jgi:sucrose-6-phosphate hydrolase SacC (GH32 family)
MSSFPSDLYPMRRWFAATTIPRHEKCVEQHLCQRDVEHYLPLYSVHRKWRNGLKVILQGKRI